MSIVAGYMVPHPPIAVAEIGKGEEYRIKDTIHSYQEVAEDIKRLQPDTILLTTPHNVMYRDYFHISPGEMAVGDFSAFRASRVQMSVTYDTSLVEAICKETQEIGIPAGIEGEKSPLLDHGTMVPLYFVTQKYKDAKLVRISLSGLPLETHWQFGKAIAKAVEKENRRCVFIASGDLSHCQKTDGPYGYQPEGPEYDKEIMDVMGRGDFEALKHFDESLLDASMECGHRSFTIMGGAFEGKKIETKQLSHEATFGVGYGFCMYHVRED